MELAATYNNFGVALMINRKLEEARDCFQKSVDIQEQAATTSMATAASWLNLGDVLDELREFDEASQCYRKALEGYEDAAPVSSQLLSHISTLDWF